jgi:hypothetical protein
MLTTLVPAGISRWPDVLLTPVTQAIVTDERIESMDESKIELIVQAVIAELKNRQGDGAEQKPTASSDKGLFAFGSHRELKSK